MNKQIIFLFIFIIIFFISCVTIAKKEYNPLDKSEISDEEANVNQKIVIFYRGTKFRKSIVDQLITHFNKNGIIVLVDHVKEIKNYNTDNYDLIIIFTGMYAFTPNYVVRNYMKKSDNKDKIIHVFCSFLTKLGVNYKHSRFTEVDTITSASIKKNKEQLVEEIIKLSEEKLKN